jgi:hypothetical protein
MNTSNRQNRLVLVSALGLAAAAVSGGASAATDYTSITSAVDATSIVAGIGAIAAVIFLPRVAKWGFRTVMSMLGR